MRHSKRTLWQSAASATLVMVLLGALAGPAISFTAKQVSKGPGSRQSAAKPGAGQAESLDPSDKIAFASDRDGNFQIYVMNANGGDQTRLTFDDADDLSPTWSPDGSKLAFVSDRNGNKQIYVMNSDGSGQTRLTNDGAEDFNPAWSPDGTKIAFVSSRDGNDEIYVMNPDGSNQTDLTNNPFDDINPAWSPNSKSLAFATNRDDNYEIYTMDADGSNQVNITNNPAKDIEPAWSPGRITFVSDRGGDTDQIYVTDPIGSFAARLSADSAYDVNPSRTSDGAKIVFASSLNGFLNIYSMNPDGSDLGQITSTEQASDIQPAVQPKPAASTASSVQFDSASYSVDKNAGSITINVTRTGNTSGTASVDFAATSGSASTRSDFIPEFGTLTFGPGDTSKSFTVSIINNAFLEGNRTIDLSLSSAQGTALGSPNSALLTINDTNTAPPTTNPIDTTAFFVRQQYLDFLNREPDAAGLQFWINNIDSCGSDAQCVEQKRVDTSAAFFLSTEFQQTGFFVYRFYKAAFARLPRFQEFLPDTEQVDRGVVIGQPGATDLLAVNERDYEIAFANRPDFQALYSGLTDAQYVATLNANAGGVLSSDQVNALVAGLQNGSETRATVLRQVVDNTAFIQSQFNSAFVLAEYFGYLRRNPNDPPDSDFSGYNFWLNKLNMFGGDFRSADMVKAFIESSEYRSRFGPP